MNQDQYCNMLFESFYEAMATCDEQAMNMEGDKLFNFLVTDMLQNSSGKHLTFSERTGTTELHTFLDAYQRRLEVNANVAETIEAEIYSNISSYSFEKHMVFKNPELREKGYSINFKPIQIKAVIDWLDLSFEVNPTDCSFAHRPNSRSYIKSFLTMKTGQKHYVKHDESDINQDGLIFTVRLHDIKSKADLLMIADLLEKQYGAEILRMKIRNIELSLDFYNANNRGLLSALHKSLRYQATADNFRIYKYVREDIRNKFNPIPHSPLMLLKRFNHDWCLGVNPKGSPLCYRLYVKTTDSKPQVNSADKAVSPTVKTEIKTIKEEAFNWDEFDASPERAKLGDDVIRMQNNNLKGAHFLPVNYGKSNLEKFMRENNLKFTMASLDCFSSDTHCSLTIAITRSKYPSKANGDFCGPMARWTAPYKDLNAWETDLRSPLDQLLFQGDAEGVLRKLDYEYQRRCS